MAISCQFLKCFVSQTRIAGQWRKIPATTKTVCVNKQNQQQRLSLSEETSERFVMLISNKVSSLDQLQ